MRRAEGFRRRAEGAGLRAPDLRRAALGVAALTSALSPQPLALSQGQPANPIIVTITEPTPKSELSGVADVLLGSLGLTGVIVLAAVLLGAAMAVVMFWVRSRQE